MGVRPPQQDGDDEVATVAFGIAALDEHLDDEAVVFPATGSELVARLGDPSVPYDAAGNEIALATALEETHAEEFETRQDLMNALHPVFEAKRERANNSIVGQLRSLLPF
jgi:hypothetical protein